MRKGLEKKIGATKIDEDNVTRILKNPIYAGIIRHKGNDYKGKHKAIIP
ncbi:recombinase family protein, partial [Candidatus Micrarchaeota archaeon]|nr:recombinase family protein [Candidatus Micrarchaeota archaeon]